MGNARPLFNARDYCYLFALFLFALLDKVCITIDVYGPEGLRADAVNLRGK